MNIELLQQALENDNNLNIINTTIQEIKQKKNEILQDLGLNRDDLLCIIEKSGSKKIGKRIPSTKISIVDEAALTQIDPTHLLILSWHIKDSLMPIFRNKGYQGLFITPLPVPVVSK